MLSVPRTIIRTASIQGFEMSIRKLCKETARRPVKALFFFPDENLTGIAPTRLIVEKERDLKDGMKVTVNWQGKRVRAEILALNGKFTDMIYVIVILLRRWLSTVA